MKNRMMNILKNTKTHRLTPDSILSRICVVSLILMIVGVGQMWADVCNEHEDAGGETSNWTGDIYVMPAFTNTDGVDLITFTYTSQGNNVELQISTNGGKNYNNVDNWKGNQTDREVSYELTGTQQNVNRVKFTIKGATLGDRYYQIKDIKFHKCPTIKLNGASDEFDETAVGSTNYMDFIISTYNISDEVEITTENVSISGTNAAMFSCVSVSDPNDDSCPTTRTLRIAYSPTSVATSESKHTATVTISAGGKSASMTVYGTASKLVTPIYTYSLAETYYVGDILDLEALWTSSSNATKVYTIDSWTAETGIPTSGATAPEIDEKDGKTLSLGQAGTLVLSLTQEMIEDEEGNGYKAGSDEGKTIRIIRRHPVLTWAEPFYFNTTTENSFSTTNNDIAFSIDSNSDTDVAILSGTTLTTYNKDANTTITISQGENFKWSSLDTTKVLRPVKTANHVPFTITSSTFKSTFYVSNTNNLTWTNGGVLLGSPDAGSQLDNYDDRFYVIRFSGIPESLSFDFERSVSIATYCDWYVQESVNGSDWTTLPNGSWTADSGSKEFALSPATRYIRFCYSGNYGGYFRNIQVTEKKQFETSVDELDFATNFVATNVASKSFKFKHTNAGYTVTATSSDATHYQLSLDNESFSSSVVIPNTGGDIRDSADVYVKYFTVLDDDEEDEETHDATINFRDQLNNITTIDVTGVTVKHNQAGSWKSNISTVKRGTKIANAYSSTLVSDDNKVIYSRLTGEGLSEAITIDEDTLIASATGTSRIRAYVKGSNLYKEIEDTIDITVTDQEIQYIVWGEGMAQTLRRLVVDGDDVELSAYATSDVVGCTTNGSREIIFESRDEDVVTVDNEEKTLTIVGKGRTWLVATQEGGVDDDSHNYIAVSDSLLVVVRDPNDVCPEYYLYNFNDSTIVRSETILGEVGANFVGGKVGLSNTIRTLTTGTFSHAPAYVTWCQKRSKDGAGSITIQQYVSGEWVDVCTRSSFEESWAKDSVAINIAATKVRAVPSESSSYLYLGSMKVGMASFAKVLERSEEKETLAFVTKIGSEPYKDVEVNWYHNRDLRIERQEGAPFEISVTDLDAGCEITTSSLRITYKPTKAETDEEYTLTFTDGREGGFRKTITLQASADAEIVTFTAADEKDHNWATGANWSSSAKPTQYQVASIKAGEEVTIATQVEAYGLTIGSGSKVTILPTGGLKVGVGGISGALATSLILETDSTTSAKGQTGYLRISPDYVGDMPSATVKLFSKAYSNDEVYNWQYVGIPLGDDNVYGWDICTYGQQYIYGWNEEAGDWFDAFEERVYPFQGYCLTQENNSKGRTFTFTGTLAAPSSTLEPISLSYTSAMADGVKGYHVLANSFAAPIDISRFDVEDFVNATATIYLFNTGYYEKGGSDGIVDVDKWEEANAGQYIAIPVETANTVREVEASFPVVIPAMQGFCVKANSTGASLKLDYNELVWKADYSKHPNKPMRVAAQKTEEQEETNESDLTDFIKVTLADGEAADNLYLLASGSYDKSYENGYDAPKMMSDDPALPNVFAVEDDGQFAIDATSDIEGTFIGVRTGAASNYTIYFSHVNAETEWMLLDIQTNKTTRIANEASYSFSAKANSLLTNRFVIVEWDGNAGTATGTEETTIQNKIQKFIYNDQLLILKDGVLYDARGMVVRR